MRNIGIRVSPRIVTFAIYEKKDANIINIEDIKIPVALFMPDALKYIRNVIIDILREYQITDAGIRITESNAQKISIERIQIEGVIQEAFASSNLNSYYVGQISSISARIGIPRTDFKKYISNDLVLENIEGWADMSINQKEAVLCAIGASHD